MIGKTYKHITGLKVKILKEKGSMFEVLNLETKKIAMLAKWTFKNINWKLDEK